MPNLFKKMLNKKSLTPEEREEQKQKKLQERLEKGRMIQEHLRESGISIFPVQEEKKPAEEKNLIKPTGP